MLATLLHLSISAYPLASPIQDELQQLQNAKRTVLMELYTLTGTRALPTMRRMWLRVCACLDADVLTLARIANGLLLCDRLQGRANCRQRSSTLKTCSRTKT